ncbi:hypothetical protein [Wolbachia endosymbiont (group A) of Gymnosoma rotundatum]|uniref:hypothetical protein n=1 Tax=Wolbachia endosymbiont (group A) of Gymnosoma rotundatum TaxID=2954016 RepID=UPI0022268F87|nr:hypothetical protein [Wolbachia endosymbiont (group A) of Gymnosoma rotundatum]
MKQSGQCLLYEHCDLRAISAREDVIPVLLSRHPSAQTLGWLCCIATYERLTIVRIISNLLKILFFCNQSDQI